MQAALISADQYEGYKNMIHSKADSFSRTTGVPKEELRAQGSLVFCEALLDFDPSRSNLSTWLWLKLDQRLFTFTNHYNQYRKLTALTLEDVTLTTTDNAFRAVAFRKALSYLSPDASVIANLVMEGLLVEWVGLSGTETAKEIRGRLFRYLRSRGWSWSRVWNAFREIKTMLKEVQK